MILIPNQLKNPAYRFVLLGKWDEYKYKNTRVVKKFYPKTIEELEKLKKEGWYPQGKAPFEPKWQTMNNYPFDHHFLQKHLAKDLNYGIVAGFGELVIRDLDNLDFCKQLIKDKKIDTFAVKTGKGLHLYYQSSYPKNIEVLNNGELRAINSFVVAPGSTHPLGTKYEVLEDGN